MSHPAKFNDKILWQIESIVKTLYPSKWINLTILDPFGGTGRIKEIFPDAIAIDIEWEWASQSGLMADSTRLPLEAGTIDLVVTSPTYGNRMADHFKASDNSRRLTYRHQIGHALHERNTGRMQWGKKYRKMHKLAWAEVARVLKMRSWFILNIKDHIRAGKHINVTDWHVKQIVMCGFVERHRIFIESGGMRFGQNHELRTGGEWIIVFQKEVRMI